MREGVVRLCEGADLVIYDTMFTAEDYQRIPHFGHSRPGDAVDICAEAGASRLALFHHAPERTDAEVDAILASTRALAAKDARKLDIVAAYEGLEMALGQR
jgi:ribonuclease BN (tRNA processing enzyme)